MPGRLQFDFTFSTPQQGPAVSQRTQRTHSAMRLLLMGDFSGRRNRGLHDSGDKLANRSILSIDIDNFNATLARLAPQLRLPMGDTEADMAIQFAHLDDFHPDELYQKLDLFQALRALRGSLLDPATFSQAAAELRHQSQLTEKVAETSAVAAGDTETILEEDQDSMFERLLGKQRTQRTATPSGVRQTESQANIQQLIQDIVSPYIVAEADPFQAQYVAAVDEAISEHMRTVLHHPDFQALEALWRSVHGLVTGIETGLENGQQLKLFLLDMTKDELADDIQSTQGQLEESGLYRLLVEQASGTLGGEPWSVLVGDYTFTTTSDDLALVAALGAIGSQAGGPFLAAADASLLGCRSLVETPDPRDWPIENKDAEQPWQALRQSSVAAWIGLAHPRILLRLPYGKDSDALDNFEFEELGQAREHEAYLWGNPAFVCALLIAAAFQTNGWDMEPGDVRDVEDLPAHTFEDEGERIMMACAEVFLSERAATAMLDRGLMPLVSYRNRNAVRLMRFQSIAEPVTALAGPWA